MAELLTHVCDGVTGQRVDTVPVSGFSYSRLLSARGDGDATVPLDGSFGKATLKALLEPWRYMLAHERDGVVEYTGYITGRAYKRGASLVNASLGDLWALWGRRIAADRTTSPVEKWQATVSGNLATHANTAMVWARDTYTGVPDASLPLTIPGVSGGPSVTRTYYGYHLAYMADFLGDLLAEGLDIYYRPEWASPGVVGWYTHAGTGWGSGVVREFSVTAPQSPVVAFGESDDGSRVTNNSIRVGEGSEVDMLTRSRLNATSPLPLLERVESVKTISDPAQLDALAVQDLVMYGSATSQWDFTVSADEPVDVGDTVRLHFDGDPWIDDGWHARRVVKVSASIPGPDSKTISVQPTGGA